MKFKSKLALALGLSVAIASSSAVAVDVDIPTYEKVSGISGKISSVGSDTLSNLMTLWAEEFQRIYPGVTIQIQSAGSSTAPPALTESTSNIGPMSRRMRATELSMFEERHGYKPLAIGVGIDALAVFVHKDNPLNYLTIPQLDAIFSENRKCGADHAVRTWSDLGVEGHLATRTLQLFGRNSVSGTYGYFKENALCGGDFSPNVNEQPGSASVVQSVSASINGIGYSGVGYRTAGVRSLSLSKREGSPFVQPTAENALNGSYPLARVLYVYINKHPNRPLDPVIREFLNLVLSQQGQAIVEKDGYIPMPAKMVAKYRKLIN